MLLSLALQSLAVLFIACESFDSSMSITGFEIALYFIRGIFYSEY